MTSLSPDLVKQALLSSVDSLLEQREDFLVDPVKDFSRIKKISFEKTLLFPMVAASDNVQTELLEFFGEDALPSPSSMIQRRDQVKPSAYIELFHRFTDKVPAPNTFHGLRLLAVDGSRINLPYNPSDPDSFIQCIKGRKGINQIHLNALYDLLNDLFIDVELQSVRNMNEKGAFCQLLERQAKDQKILFIADRGYASFNIFATAIRNNSSFLIRVPESFARSICSDDPDWLSRDRQDALITVHVGRRRTVSNRSLANYHCIPKKGHYDFIPPGSDRYDVLRLRVLKFPVSDDSFTYVVTNLPPYSFPSDTIRELYRIRWGVETAFRHLKYAGGMVHIHSLKRNLLIQEIFSKLTLYNFSSCIASCAGDEVNKTTAKYSYTVNHTQLQKICLRFLRGTVSHVMDLLRGMVVPIRPGRSFHRNLRRQSADTLVYR